jgi:hypothetical protein
VEEGNYGKTLGFQTTNSIPDMRGMVDSHVLTHHY